MFSNPERVASTHGGDDATPLGLMTISIQLPRVARSSQPWAERWNPFGILGRNFRKALGFVGTLMILAVLIGSAITGRAGDNFARGIELTHAGEYPEAAAAFAEAAQAQPAVGTLVDLGLAEWQRGHAGAAILAWERARWIDPLDARAETNLKFARQVTQADEPQLRWHEIPSTWLPSRFWMSLTGVSLWLAVGLLVLPGIFRRRVAGWQQTLAALAFGLFLFGLTADVGVVSRTHIGFVLKKNVPLRLTPTREGEIISDLAAGEPGREIRTRGNYIFVRTANGSGWLERDQFQGICPP
jgi:tetratricopeptide (TPR) repeat protein